MLTNIDKAFILRLIVKCAERANYRYKDGLGNELNYVNTYQFIQALNEEIEKYENQTGTTSQDQRS